MRLSIFHRLIAIIPVCMGTPAIAQTDQQKIVQAWFDQAWADAQRFPDLEGYSLSWTVQQYSTLTPEEVDRLRREVQGHPEHPDRHTLEAIDRSRGGPISVHNYTLWAQRDGQWRFNSATARYPGMYMDAALTESSAWLLSPGTLNMMDPGREPPPGKDIRGNEHVFLPDVGLLLNGGLTTAWLAGSLRPGTLHAQNGRWSVQASMRRQVRGDVLYAIEYSGRWDAEHSRGFIDRMEIKPQGAAGATAESYAALNWRPEPTLNRWVASQVAVYTAAGMLDRRIRFVSAEPVNAEAMRALLATPEADRADPVRGTLNLTQVNDWTSGSLLMATSAGAAKSPLVRSATQSQRDRWQLIGWVLGASLVAGLLGLAWRKHLARS